MASLMRANGITLGAVQRTLVAVSDCTTSVYNFIFSLIVLLYFFSRKDNIDVPGHGESRYYGAESRVILSYLTIWCVGEAIGCISTLIIRFYSICRSLSGNRKALEKLLIFKFMAFLHYFLVLCGTAGFLGEWTQNSTSISPHKHNMLKNVRLTLFVGQVLTWSCLVALFCMIFSLYWSIIDDKSLEDAQSFWHCLGFDSDDCSNNICCLPFNAFLIPILNQIYRVVFCPFYFVGHIIPSSETLKRALYVPVFIFINVFTVPIRVFSFFVALGAQAVGMVVFACTFGLPYYLIPESLAEVIVNVRNMLWQNHPLKFFPAIIPVAIFLFLCTFGVFIGIYILIWICICAWCCNAECAQSCLLYIATFCRMCFDTIVGSRNGLGVRYDAMISLVPLTFFLLLLVIIVSSMILADVSPASIVSVCKSLIDSPSSAYSILWIVCKIIQLSVSTLLPLIRLFALGKLNRLRSLLEEYPKYQLLLYVVSVLELYLIDDDLDTQRRSSMGSRPAQDMFSTGAAVSSSSVGSGTVVTVYNAVSAPEAIRYTNPREELIAKVDEFRVKLQQMTLSIEEEINDIAYILFDYDFTQKGNGDYDNDNNNDDDDGQKSSSAELPSRPLSDSPLPNATSICGNPLGGHWA